MGNKMIIPPILTTHLYITLKKGWENVLFELGSERVKHRVVHFGFAGLHALTSQLHYLLN